MKVPASRVHMVPYHGCPAGEAFKKPSGNLSSGFEVKSSASAPLNDSSISFVNKSAESEPKKVSRPGSSEFKSKTLDGLGFELETSVPCGNDACRAANGSVKSTLARI